MRDLSQAGPVEWFVFPDPTEDDVTLRINLSFLASNWRCLYGQGCPGIFPKDSKHIVPDSGCCVDGFYVEDKKEFNSISKAINKLTDADWDKKLRKEFLKTGRWSVIRRPFPDTPDDEEDDEKTAGIVKSRTVDGACIFSNRANGSAGKPGCAFLHMGNRLNADRNNLFDNSEEHADYMPTICSRLPLYAYSDDNGDYVLTAWSNDKWNEENVAMDEDGTSDSFAHWWCVDGTDAYSNDKMLVYSMKKEIIKILGEVAYGIIVEEIQRRMRADGFGAVSSIRPMPASPEGRKTLMMLQDAPATIAEQVGSRTPKRTAK